MGEEPPIGREQEIARLRRVLAAPRTEPRLLEITGDPGIGKTRLLEEWATLAEAAGLTVLAGRLGGADDQRPFALFRRPVALALDLPAAARALTPPDRALLLRYVTHGEPIPGPGTRPAGQGEGTESPDEIRDRLRRCITGLLWAAAEDLSLTLCLDDLHWADDDSVGVLNRLLREPRPRSSLILVCSVRPRQRPTALAAALAAPEDAYRVERFRLGPLQRGRLEDIMGPAQTVAGRRLRYEAADGNPFYLRVLAQSPGPLLPPGGVNPWVLSDESVLAASAPLARELGALDPVELETLRAAAMLGEKFDPAHVADLTGRDVAATMSVLDRLVSMDLVRTDHTRERACRLRHPLLRAVVYQGAPHGWRRTAHQRVDRILGEAGAEPAQRAPHVVRCAQPGDQDAVRLLAEAADQVRMTDPAAAASWLRTALSLNRQGGDGLRTRLMTSLARALGAVGQLRESRELLTRVSRSAAPDVVVFHAMIERHLGNYGGAEALLTAELGRMPGWFVHSAALSGPLRLELATVRLLRRDFSDSQELAEGVLRQATARQDRPLRLAATVCLTHCSAFAADVPALLDRAREAGALLDATADSPLVPHLDTVSQLGWAETLAERHHDALRHTARGIRLAQTSGQAFVLPYLRLAHAYASVSVGRLADALRSAEEAEEDAHRMQRPALLGFALALRAWATSMLDGPDAAAPIAERAVQEVGAGGRLWAVTAGVLAEVRLGQDRPAESLDLTRSALNHDRHPGTAQSIKPLWYALGARAAAALGDTDEAAVWARRASRDADLLDLPGQRGHAALARAHSGADPVPPLKEAIEGFRAGGLALMECRARLLLAAELISRDLQEQAQALEHVNRAKSLAEIAGARHLYREAVDMQRRLGARRPRAVSETQAAVPNMSAREREITRMVLLGLSNTDIARVLVISPKTVEAHLTRVFRKAGVRSRIALIAALSRAEPDSSP
ncbi:AAA family ATPase [Streptomyces griseorubiginosus]|uniref:ATP-binding protein n=1 Tax=Streptomyces griseorubiginosus TaxID=67304 RepID=UPI0033B43860